MVIKDHLHVNCLALILYTHTHHGILFLFLCYNFKCDVVANRWSGILLGHFNESLPQKQV